MVKENVYQVIAIGLGTVYQGTSLHEALSAHNDLRKQQRPHAMLENGKEFCAWRCLPYNGALIASETDGTEYGYWWAIFVIADRYSDACKAAYKTRAKAFVTAKRCIDRYNNNRVSASCL